MASDLFQQLGSREITKAKLFEKVEADFRLLPTMLEGTFSSKATVRYGCGSTLVDLSEKHPDKLYPYMNNFIALLNSQHRILVWNALAAIANLTSVDSDRKFDAIFGKYYGFLGNEYMVTVANVVAYSAKIAANKPYLGDRIASELLKVQNLQTTPHLTEECKLVIAEHAIRTFNTLIRYTKNKAALIVFAEKYQNSKRISLKKEAQNFLKKWQLAWAGNTEKKQIAPYPNKLSTYMLLLDTFAPKCTYCSCPSDAFPAVRCSFLNKKLITRIENRLFFAKRTVYLP